MVEIVGIGETVWDMLPDGPQLGGAPLNFAVHCRQLGHASALVSRVGNDELGRAALQRLRERGVIDRHVQTDPAFPTCTAQIAVDEQGQPTFRLRPQPAYDRLEWSEGLEALVRQARAVCFGTLAQHHPTARATVQRLVRVAQNAVVIYDVNLRPDLFDRDVIENSLHLSTWAKLNEEELIALANLWAWPHRSASEQLAQIRRQFHLGVVALTRGPNGCLVQSANQEVDLPGIPVRVVDTVGAGDAFTAGLLVATLEGKELREAAGFANRLAARVAASAGGTPMIARNELESGA